MCFIVFKYFIVSKCLKHKKEFLKTGLSQLLGLSTYLALKSTA